MDWSQGYECEWIVSKIDPKSWIPVDKMRKVNSMTINRDATDDVPLLETASLSTDGDFEDGWYQISLRAKQYETTSMEHLGTFRMSSDSSSYFGSGRKMVSVNGVSVLQPCADMKCKIGEYAPKGKNGAEWVRELLAKCTPAPIRIDGQSFDMANYYVFDSGTKVIEAVWTILDAAGWCLQIEGDGTIVIKEKPSTAKYIMDRDMYGILQPQFDFESDISKIPNVYRMVAGDKEIEVVNDDPDSETSTVRRGYRIEEVDTSPQLLIGESYENYGKRQLVTLSSTLNKWSYSREYIPGLYLFDLWECRRNEIGLNGDGRILTQKLTCDKGIVVEEKIGIEVKDYVTNYVELQGS